MDRYDLIEFTNYDIPNNVDLSMSIIKWGGEKNEENFIFLDKLDTKYINISGNLKLLDEVKTQNFIEQYVYVDFDFFIKDIKQTFKNENEIRNQFNVDLVRCKVYLNKHLISDPDEVRNFLDFKYSKDVANNIMMLTTQALLGLPFQIIFNNISEKYHLAELDSNSKDKRPYRISINIDDKNIEFKAYKEFRIFSIINSNPINLFKVYVKLDFDLKTAKTLLINIKITKYHS